DSSRVGCREYVLERPSRRVQRSTAAMARIAGGNRRGELEIARSCARRDVRSVLRADVGVSRLALPTAPRGPDRGSLRTAVPQVRPRESRAATARRAEGLPGAPRRRAPAACSRAERGTPHLSRLAVWACAAALELQPLQAHRQSAARLAAHHACLRFGPDSSKRRDRLVDSRTVVAPQAPAALDAARGSRGVARVAGAAFSSIWPASGRPARTSAASDAGLRSREDLRRL